MASRRCNSPRQSVTARSYSRGHSSLPPSWATANTNHDSHTTASRSMRRMSTARSTGHSRPVTRARTATTAASTYQDQSSSSQIICAITESRGTSPTIGLAHVDLSTSRASLCEIVDNQTYTKTIHKLWIWDCKVLLLPSIALSPTPSRLATFLKANSELAVQPTPVDRTLFDESEGLSRIDQLALADELATIAVALEGKCYAVASFAAVIEFLRGELGITFSDHGLRIVYEPSEGTMMVDLSTIRSLELIQNLHDRKSKDCLFGLLDCTMTPMGSRLLRSNVLQPLTDVDMILKRHDAVGELISSTKLFSDVRRSLRGFQDVDRILTDLIIKPGPRKIYDWLLNCVNYVLVLKGYIVAAEDVYTSLTSASSLLLQQIRRTCEPCNCLNVREQIRQWINEDTIFSKKPAELQEQRLYAVKSGMNGLLDVARQAFRETLDDVFEHCEELKTSHGFSFVIKFDNGRGRYLQFPCDELQQRALDTEMFIHVVRNKKYVECQTMDLIKLNTRLSSSYTEIMNMSTSAVQQLVENIRREVAPLIRMSDSIALLDVLTALANVASQYSYVKPMIGSKLAIKAARHPILIADGKRNILPNDIYADDRARLQIIQGCNMSGKSTYIRTIPMLQIMAQIGSFIPATYAMLKIQTQIFARVSTDDNLTANMSTFSNEMRETAYILKNVSSSSLVIIDELGRGTGTTDGLAIATAIAEALLGSKANTWLVTHFRQLATFLSSRPGVVNLHLAVDVQPVAKKLIMSYKLSSGLLRTESYGILLATALNIPGDIIACAKSVSGQIRNDRYSEFKAHNHGSGRRRKLLLGLEQQLILTQEMRLQDSALTNWLIELQQEFCKQMSELCEQEFANSTPAQQAQQVPFQREDRLSDLQNTDIPVSLNVGHDVHTRSPPVPSTLPIRPTPIVSECGSLDDNMRDSFLEQESSRTGTDGSVSDSSMMDRVLCATSNTTPGDVRKLRRPERSASHENGSLSSVSLVPSSKCEEVRH